MLRAARRGAETSLGVPPASDEDDSDDRADPEKDACIRGEVTEKSNTAGVGAAEPFTALRALMPSWMTRVNDIFKTLGSHNLLCTPNEAAFADAELGPLIRRYLPGANGITAEERARIFRMAWDFAGSALGSRSELYERFYLASQPRNLTGNHMTARTGREWTDVDDFRHVSGIE